LAVQNNMTNTSSIGVTPRPVSVGKPLSPARLAIRRFSRNRLGLIGSLFVGIFVFCAIFAPVISPHDYQKTSAINAYKSPGESPEYLLGTDESGRDMLSRLIWGARTSLVVSLTAQAIMLVLGLLLGFSAGWFGGWIDFIVNRIIEVFIALPALLFRILVVIVLGGGVLNLVLAISLLAWPELARLVRAQVLAYRGREFVEASEALGSNTREIALRHVLPNIINPIIVAVTFSIPSVIILESSLSFLGYGINEPTPSWGKMVGGAANYIQSYWHLGILPTICLSVVMIGFSFFGDAIRDALDPRGAQKQA
jgi:ABC-type dipeptide/oligopeptide/nickel transport system permease subunit